MTNPTQAEVPAGIREPMDRALEAIRDRLASKDQRIELLECALATVAANLRRAPDKGPAVAVFASAILRGRTLMEAVSEAEQVGEPASIVEVTPSTPVQGAGEAFHETGVPLNVDTPPAPDNAADEVQALRETLAWYGEQARLARLIHSEGDAGRQALDADGGKRARTALARSTGE